LNRHRLAVAVLFIVATAWGASFTLVKNVLTHIAAEPFIFYRFTLAGVVLLAIALAWRQLRRAAVFPGALLGLLVFAGYWCQTRGLMAISPSRSAFLTSLYAVLVPFADRILFATPIPLRAWAASILATFGTMLLISGFPEGLHGRPSFADVLTLLCAGAFALHVVLAAKYSAVYSALGLAAVQVLVVGLAAAPASAFAPRPEMSAAIVAAIVLTALVTTALAFVALMWGQARVSATDAAVILAFEPVAAAATSIVFDHEPLTTAFVIGGSLILGAMILAQLPQKTKRDPLPSG
jgi:drug/metabolite transporter (DMT)-like permease